MKYELDTENNRFCKALHLNCFDKNEQVDCDNCQFIEKRGNHFYYNKEYFDSHNICPTCGGSGKIVIPKWAVKDLKEDEIHKCFDCEGTGLMTKYLRFQIQFEKSQGERYRDELGELITYIKETSTCSICHGDRHRTYGGIRCKECGLIGTMPWGG